MQVSTANSVKVYNLSAGKSLPEWISERKRRALLKTDIGKKSFSLIICHCSYIILLSGLRRRIELIQDFTMPVASTKVQTSPDGQYILATGKKSHILLHYIMCGSSEKVYLIINLLIY